MSNIGTVRCPYTFTKQVGPGVILMTRRQTFVNTEVTGYTFSPSNRISREKLIFFGVFNLLRVFHY